MKRVTENSQAEAGRWLKSARQPKDPVTSVYIRLSGYGLDDWARRMLAEQIVALVNLKEKGRAK